MFVLKESKQQNISKLAIYDTRNGHNTEVLLIPDYLSQGKEFGNMVCKLLNTNNRFKIPKDLV